MGCSVYWLQMLNVNTKLAWRPSWQSLLANGTVNNPVHNNLTGIVYGMQMITLAWHMKLSMTALILGDYFFIKAGNELVSRGLAHC